VRRDEPRVIEADHYRETRAKLKADPILQGMVQELRDDDVCACQVDMNAALQEYKRRGGTVQTHIGGPVQAIRELMRDS
jgi:hypothetical protein